MENDPTDIYQKPRGKSYRTTSRRKLPRKEEIVGGCNKITSKKEVVTDCSVKHDSEMKLHSPPPSPTTPISSDDSDDFGVNADIITFINGKKEFILNLISDTSYSSDMQCRSERIEHLKQCDNIKSFEERAREEYFLICRRMETYIGKSTLPYIPYTEHMNTTILREKR